MPLSKIFAPDIAARASFSLDSVGDAFFAGGVAGGYGILVGRELYRQYILAPLNRKLLEWYIRQSATQMRDGYYSYESRFIRHLPIHTINLSNRAERPQHDKIVALVESMLQLNKQLSAVKSAGQKGILQRQIEATDRQIDQLVYQLYGL